MTYGRMSVLMLDSYKVYIPEGCGHSGACCDSDSVQVQQDRVKVKSCGYVMYMLLRKHGQDRKKDVKGRMKKCKERRQRR
jgi:hypothetical protein